VHLAAVVEGAQLSGLRADRHERDHVAVVRHRQNGQRFRHRNEGRPDVVVLRRSGQRDFEIVRQVAAVDDEGLAHTQGRAAREGRGYARHARPRPVAAAHLVQDVVAVRCARCRHALREADGVDAHVVVAAAEGRGLGQHRVEGDDRRAGAADLLECGGEVALPAQLQADAVVRLDPDAERAGGRHVLPVKVRLELVRRGGDREPLALARPNRRLVDRDRGERHLLRLGELGRVLTRRHEQRPEPDSGELSPVPAVQAEISTASFCDDAATFAATEPGASS
jgi:hypothetical protein